MSANQDINGKESIKREWAAKLLIASLTAFSIYFLVIFIYLIVWIVLLYKGKTEIISALPELPSALMQMWFGITGAGFSALGLTLWEKKK